MTKGMVVSFLFVAGRKRDREDEDSGQEDSQAECLPKSSVSRGRRSLSSRGRFEGVIFGSIGGQVDMRCLILSLGTMTRGSARPLMKKLKSGRIC